MAKKANVEEEKSGPTIDVARIRADALGGFLKLAAK